MKFMNALQPLGLLLLRVALAVIFIYYGYPKLAHAGGEMQKYFVQHGMPGYFVYIAGISETFGGGLLLLGLFTRPAALFLAIEMGVAVWTTSGGNYMAVHNYELPFVMAAACFALATVGAGMISVDHAVFGEGGGRSRTAKSSKK
jgi:putative oxidoreductase